MEGPLRLWKPVSIGEWWPETCWYCREYQSVNTSRKTIHNDLMLPRHTKTMRVHGNTELNESEVTSTTPISYLTVISRQLYTSFHADNHDNSQCVRHKGWSSVGGCHGHAQLQQSRKIYSLNWGCSPQHVGLRMLRCALPRGVL